MGVRPRTDRVVRLRRLALCQGVRRQAERLHLGRRRLGLPGGAGVAGGQEVLRPAGRRQIRRRRCRGGGHAAGDALLLLWRPARLALGVPALLALLGTCQRTPTTLRVRTSLSMLQLTTVWILPCFWRLGTTCSQFHRHYLVSGLPLAGTAQA